jgi:uncharacterized protein YndB with AHSA1/START domain
MRLIIAASCAALALAPPAAAEVFQKAENGFVVRQAAEVKASPDETWAELLKPAGWWSKQHTWSGDAANLSIEARAGGCFCEVLPNKESPRASPRGSVEHMRVIYVEQARALRMAGGLGPLQSEPVTGVLTVTLKPRDGGGTRIQWEYVVGGWFRYKVDQIAPAVDGVLGEQLQWLAMKLGPETPTAPPPAAGAAAAKPMR